MHRLPRGEKYKELDLGVREEGTLRIRTRRQKLESEMDNIGNKTDKRKSTAQEKAMEGQLRLQPYLHLPGSKPRLNSVGLTFK